MKLLLPAAALILLTAAPARAEFITLDFEGPTSFASIADYYDGGTDSDGAAGPDLGVSFGLDALGLKNDVLGPYFSNAPSPLGAMAPVGPDAAMNVAVGFKDVSFYYSSPEDVLDGVEVWGGLNGTGLLLATFHLTKNAEAEGDNRYGHWDNLFSGALAGTAHSLTFTNAVGFAGFDNIGFTPVPEPTSAVLFAMGLAGLWPFCRRR
jgi:hypothetical protein